MASAASEVGDTQTSVLLGTIRMRQIRVQYSQAWAAVVCWFFMAFPMKISLWLCENSY